MVGTSGSGKTTLGRQVSEVLGIPHLEMDSITHRGGWNATTKEVFVKELQAFISAPRWVVDGNYSSMDTPEVVWPRADTFVWLDLSKTTTMRRVMARTIKRVITREKLWGEIEEPWSNLYSRDPHKNIMVWAWTNFDHNREKYEAAMTDGSWSHATVHRLRTPQEVDAFVSQLESNH